MHKSVRMNTPIEFINVTPLNPLISRCEIKVCYVGDEPNRNHSIITKEVAAKMANSLPGSPIVGYYNETKEDFEEHNRIIDLSNGKFEIRSTTRPYGFVDLNAKVWFQKFLDDGQYEREYLMTEGWLWTEQYPECKRILTKGNNQSMELNEEHLNAHWTKDDNGDLQFFIINEAIIENLCILGEDVEPCFEGASITEPVIRFAFEDGFKEQLFSMINELKEILNEGGKKVFTRYAVEIGDTLWTALYGHTKDTHSIVGVYEDGEQKFAVLSADDKFYRLDFSFSETNEVIFSEEVVLLEEYVADEDPQFSAEDVAAYAASLETPPADSEPVVEMCEGCGNPVSECICNEDKIGQYNLDEIQEYVELKNNYTELEIRYAALEQQLQEAQSTIESLNTFKQGIERAEKEKMIESFYMLSDEDKEDVVANIDSYSLGDIEAKLSVICVRNKLSFAREEGQSNAPTSYNLGSGDDDAPAWVKALRSVAKDMQ